MIVTKPLKHNIYITYPSGADYVECPLCEKFLLTNKKYSKSDDNSVEYINITYDNGKKIDAYYCLTCETIFMQSHTYSYNGCTSNLDHAYIVSNFSYDGVDNSGYPCFESYMHLDELVRSKKLNKVILSCTCNDTPSNPNAFYPESKYPQYYKKCTKNIVLNDITEIFWEDTDVTLTNKDHYDDSHNDDNNNKNDNNDHNNDSNIDKIAIIYSALCAISRVGHRKYSS